MNDPVQLLASWLEEAREAGLPTPAAMTLVTVSDDGRPSARVVSLKRLEDGALVFTTGLWTRKAEELRGDPRVASVFHWPALGRQARIEGHAEIAERELAEELFAERPRSHQLQAHVSRQGEVIDDLSILRARLEVLKTDRAGRSSCVLPSGLGRGPYQAGCHRVLDRRGRPPSRAAFLRDEGRGMALLAPCPIGPLPVMRLEVSRTRCPATNAVKQEGQLRNLRSGLSR